MAICELNDPLVVSVDCPRFDPTTRPDDGRGREKMLVDESGYMLRGMERGGTQADKTTALCPSDQRPSVAEAGFGKV